MADQCCTAGVLLLRLVILIVKLRKGRADSIIIWVGKVAEWLLISTWVDEQAFGRVTAAAKVVAVLCLQSVPGMQETA